MKKRLKGKYIILLILSTSFLSVLYYISLFEIKNFENKNVESIADDSLFDKIYSLDTSYELNCTYLFENVPKIDIKYSFEELLRKNEVNFFLFIAGTYISLEFLVLLKNFSKHETPREYISLDIEGIKLTEAEKRIFTLIQEFLSCNRIFNKEKVATYIKSRYNVNRNLNYIGIKAVIDSLIKKNIILEGSKLTRETILLNSNRYQILNLIKENPGIYKNSLAKKLNLCPYVINWHLSMLIKFHIVRERNIDEHISYYEFSLNTQSDKIFHTISKDRCMRIIEFLKMSKKGCTKYQIAKVLHMHYNTIIKYLNKLEEYNLLIRKKDTNKELLFLNISNFNKLIF